MSTYDNLLRDLDDLDDLEGDGHDESDDNNQESSSNKNEKDFDDESDLEGDRDTLDVSNTDEPQDILKAVTAKLVSSVGHFRKTSKYLSHLHDIHAAMSKPPTFISGFETHGLLEQDNEYALVLECNRFVQSIDEEIAETHRLVVETYAHKFPELEQLVPNKLDYVRTVLRIGNEMDMTLVELNDLLPAATVMVVSVTGSTTSGRELTESELKTCMKGSEEVLALHEDKMKSLQFVESRMTRLAPNISALVGSRIAAQLVDLAGGGNVLHFVNTPCQHVLKLTYL